MKEKSERAVRISRYSVTLKAQQLERFRLPRRNLSDRVVRCCRDGIGTKRQLVWSKFSSCPLPYARTSLQAQVNDKSGSIEFSTMPPIIQSDFGAYTASDLCRRTSHWTLTTLASIEKQLHSSEASVAKCGTLSVRVFLVPSPR